MGSKHLGADINVAWPTAQIAVMGAQGAANIVHRKTLKKVADDGRRRRGPARRAHRRVRDHARQPLHRGRAGLHRRRHRPARDPHRDRPLAAAAALQAGDAPAQEAREHPALMTDEQQPTSSSHRSCRSSTPTRPRRRSPHSWRCSPRSGRAAARPRSDPGRRGAAPPGAYDARTATAPAPGGPAACRADPVPARGLRRRRGRTYVGCSAENQSSDTWISVSRSLSAQAGENGSTPLRPKPRPRSSGSAPARGGRKPVSNWRITRPRRATVT